MTGWRAAHGSGKDNEKEEEKRGNKYEDPVTICQQLSQTISC